MRIARTHVLSPVLLTTLLFADACRLPEPVVPAADEMLIRASVAKDWNGAGGFDIVAGWNRTFSNPFDATVGSVSWTDGQDLFVGRDFASGVALGVANPPSHWRSDADGLTWTTAAGELWTARPGLPARIIWRFPGLAESFVLSGSYVFLTLASGGAADAAPREIWRVAKATGEAVRVAMVAGSVASMVADGDDLFFVDREARLRHVEGTVEHDREVARKLWGLVGVDAGYVYGSDRSYLYRAPRSGGAAMAIARFGEWGATPLASGAYAALDGDQLLWIEGGDLFAAPTAGGSKRLLANVMGAANELVPAGDAIYVREVVADQNSARVLRVSKGGTAAPQETAAAYESVFNFTAHGARLYWMAGDKLWGAENDGAPVLLATLGPPEHAVDSVLVADDAYVFFMTDAELLWRVPTGGGVPEKVADWQDLLPRPAGDQVTTCCAPAQSVALDPQNIFFLSRSRGAVARAPKDGVNNRGALVLASGLARPRALQVDDGNVYVMSDGEIGTSCHAHLTALPKTGEPSAVLASDLSCGSSIALTATTVWITSAGESVKRVSKSGGPATAFATLVASERVSLAGAGDTLFFSAGSRIFKMNDKAIVPSVIASGLLDPASAMLIEGRTLFFVDAHSSKGIPGSRLQRVPQAY